MIVVTDNGVGIPPDICERIFDPFFTSKPPDRGTGLGLSTVQSIVAAHGGSIAVRSLPAGGTEFRISLPAAAEPGVATESAGPQPASARAAAHGTILLGDDWAPVRAVAAATTPPAPKSRLSTRTSPRPPSPSPMPLRATVA